jgi:hypothetical protein
LKVLHACNRPLGLQFLRGITMRNMCPRCSQLGIQQHVYSGFCLETIY